ncbi:MAG: surface antigen, partial [Segetibacter sp.]|nr:surface antigen [Segetibacter sp.]
MEIRKIKKTSAYLVCLALIVLLNAGCNITKNVPAGDALYTGATIKLTNSSAGTRQNKVLKSDLQGLLRPKPNSSILGIKFKLGLYNMAGKSNNFINKFLRKNG